MNIPLVGILFLGGFVGYLLCWSFQISKRQSVKSALAIIGGALGGAPIAFMQGLGSEKWAYPVGLVLGLVWAGLRARSLSKTQHGAGGSATPASWNHTILATVITLVFVGAFSFSDSPENAGGIAKRTTRAEMPCQWAWIFLGRYSQADQRYELSPSFRYADASILAPIPRPGQQIVTTRVRTLIISNYAAAPAQQKCNGILNPPLNYRPETANQFEAGSLAAGSEVTVNQVALLPRSDAEPVYVWALVGSGE